MVSQGHSKQPGPGIRGYGIKISDLRLQSADWEKVKSGTGRVKREKRNGDSGFVARKKLKSS